MHKKLLPILLILSAFCLCHVFISCGEFKEADIITKEDLERQGLLISKDKVTGFLQKGPFLRSATVTLYELNGDLAQTGRSFTGTITDDRGSFEISGIELASPYVRLNAHGFYLNEVSGAASTTQITLNSIADIKDKSNANANILTHLEYERVLNLAGGGKSVADAKRQAQGEILAIFGIGENLSGSDDMSIFGRNESSAVLLAISVLLQGSLSEAMFSVLLTDFNQSIKSGGTWNDEPKKAEIADWASAADLGKIRANIEGWNLSVDVPDFERYIRNFWSSNYGLGVCNPGSQGNVRENVNPHSVNAGKEYVCQDYIWREYVPSSSSSSGSDSESSSSGEVSSSSYSSDASSSSEYTLSSSSAVISSSSEPPSSSSAEPSSSSAIPSSSSVVPSSSSVAASSSSALPSSSSADGGNSGTFTDTRDSKPYKWVKIGSQVWMAENLNYNASGSRCYGDNTGDDSQNRCGTYGRLYNWATAMNNDPSSSAVPSGVQGVCPPGWHLPSDDEWGNLITEVGGASSAGTKLKADNLWAAGGTTGTDDFGFSALPGGLGFSFGSFYFVGNDGYWWSATQDDASNAWSRFMIYDDSLVSRDDLGKSSLLSVRCVRDSAAE